MKIELSDFSGMVPRTAAHKLAAEQAQYAENCAFDGGTLRPVLDTSDVYTLPDALRTTIYPYNGSWLSWVNDVDVVKAPITDDTYDRIYYTGDGTPKVRGTDGGTEYEYTLGIPAPTNTPTVTVVTKTATSWTRSWGYFYEESDGTHKDAGTLVEGVDIAVTTVGSAYTLASIPARVTATSDAVFVMWFDAYDSSGNIIGRCYPKHSSNYLDSDLYIDGAKVNATQTNSTTALFELAYDTSDATDYTAERSYVYTFVSAWGEEGPPSEESATVAVDPTQDAIVANMDTSMPTGGTYNITKKRLYRTVTGSTGTEWQFVVELDLATGTYTDSLTDADTAEVIQSTDWGPPPTDLTGLVCMPGGFLAGFSGKSVYFSAKQQPHAWPDAYVQPVDETVIGLGVTGNTLVVMTTSTRYAMVGSAPDAISVSRIALPQSCVSKRSIAEYGTTVIDAAPDGLVATDGGNADVASRKWFTRAEWQPLDPETMQIKVHDDAIFLFSDAASMVLDFSDDKSILSYTDETCSGMYVDPDTDLLYLIQSDTIRSWNTAATYKTLTWKSRRYELERPHNWSVVRVLATTYTSITLKLYADGVLVSTSTVTSGTAFRLPKLARAKRWEFQVEATDEIQKIIIADGMNEVA